MVYTDEELKAAIEVILTIYIIAYIHAYTYICTHMCDISETDPYSTVLGQYENFPNEEVSHADIYVWPELD
jgi:hypothetical protein